MKRHYFHGGLLVTLALAGWAHAVGPDLITYQGRVLTSGGSPVADGPHTFEFDIFTVSSGGTPLWSESDIVTTSEGLFTQILGLSTALPTSLFTANAQLWLEVTFEGEAQLPRTQLTSSGNALAVNTVAGATGGTVMGEMVVRGAGANDVLVLGVDDPNIALELRSGTFGGSPFIDFANDATEDSDARIQLNGDKGLQIYVDTSLTIPVGRVGIGTSDPGTQPGLENVRLEIADTDGLLSDVALRVAGPSGSAAQDFAKSRGTLSSPTIVQDGDLLGSILFIGYDGSDFANAAAWIRAAVDGTPGTNDMPGRLQFMTTADGAANPTVRMTINNAGNIGVGTANPAYRLEVAGPMMMEDGAVPSVSAGHSGVYSSGGELFALDQAGNSTQLSPHDPGTGEWVFYSMNVRTGRVVRVDMERLVRAVERLTGERFLMESWMQVD
jgi:hypothetical protein